MADWECVVALRLFGDGSTSVGRLHAVVTALGYDPALTSVSFMLDDLNGEWTTVAVPLDDPPEPVAAAPGVPVEAPPPAGFEVFKPAEITAAPPPVEVPIADEPTVDDVIAATDLPLTRFCRDCGREFASRDAARDHEAEDHPNPDAICCDDCGWVFGTPRGFAHHVTMKHTVRAAKGIVVTDDLAERVQRDLAPYVANGPGPPAQWAPNEPMLSCGDCTWYGTEVSALVGHTSTVHDRRPTDTERTPLPPDRRAERLAQASGG